MKRTEIKRAFGKGGFTLMEVMIAGFVGASILVAAITFILSLSELWGHGNEARLFNKHVRGVSRFLEQAFQKTSYRYLSEEEEEDSDSERTPVYWSNRGGRKSKAHQYLTFELERSPGLLIWPGDPMPYVVCSLEYDRGDGLYLLWRSRLEEEFGEKEPRRTLISPFVVDIRYYYLEEGDEDAQWEIEEEPRKGRDTKFELPRRLELTFEYGEEQVVRQIVLPSVFQGLPVI